METREPARGTIGYRTIREVTQGPDGAVYLLTDDDDGKLLRLTPASGS
jgi:aldose sugar dehydrogenase